MKRLVAAILGTMVMGGATLSPALATPAAPEGKAPPVPFAYMLHEGMNLVELQSGGSIAIEKKDEVLYAWATSAAERSALGDGLYELAHVVDVECMVEDGILVSCE